MATRHLFEQNHETPGGTIADETMSLAYGKYATPTLNITMAELVTWLETKLNLIPPGLISLWSGAIVNIPSGWALCDGTSGTPNLSSKFVVGYNSGDADYNAIGNTGGEKTHALLEAELAQHNHAITINEDGSHNHYFDGYGDQTLVDSGGYVFAATSPESVSSSDDGSHTHSASSANVGSGTAHENRPPYYTLAYIMKL